MLDRPRVVAELHTLQGKIYDAKELLGGLPVGRLAGQLSTLYDLLESAEQQLADVLDQNDWG